jgi:SPP1 family predicted phage head-tail adaptor
MKCCQITTGMLNRKIELQSLVKTPTATGGFTQSWVSVATLWAKIKNTSGSELLHADQLGATSFSDFTIRYRANINETMKLVYRSTDYQIRHINNIEEADLWLVVKGERGVSQ